MQLTTVDDDGVGHEGGLPCFAADPRPYFPNTATLVNPAVIVPVNQYGAIGFSAAGQNPRLPHTVPPWFTCPFLDWSDGPEFEGVPQIPVFTFRWQAFLNLHSGLMFYRRAGQPLTQAPAGLFPAPLPVATTTDITLSFDSNARPVFAHADTAAGMVNIARFVAGVPTFNSFAGSSPKLIFDGQMQRDNTLTDVVIYYLRAGIVRARFQRDNFGIEYTIANVTGTYGAITRLTKTDRNIPSGNPSPVGNPIFQYLFAQCGPLIEIELIAGPYPVWPLSVSDNGSLRAGVPGGLYSPVIVPGGSYAEDGTLTVKAPSGTYALVVVVAPGASDDGSLTVSPPAGSYALVVVAGGTFTDDGTLTVGTPGGSYALVIIPGGTYTDDGSLTIGAPGGTYS